MACSPLPLPLCRDRGNPLARGLPPDWETGGYFFPSWGEECGSGRSGHTGPHSKKFGPHTRARSHTFLNTLSLTRGPHSHHAQPPTPLTLVAHTFLTPSHLHRPYLWPTLPLHSATHTAHTCCPQLHHAQPSHTVHTLISTGTRALCQSLATKTHFSPGLTGRARAASTAALLNRAKRLGRDGRGGAGQGGEGGVKGSRPDREGTCSLHSRIVEEGEALSVA